VKHKKHSSKYVRTTTAIALIFLAILLSTCASYFVFGNSSTTFTISSGVYSGAPSFTVYREDSKYYAKNAYGVIEFSGTNFTLVFENCLDNLPTYGGKILLKTGYYEGWIVIDRDGVLLEGEGCYCDIPSGIPDNSPTELYGTVIKVTTAGKDAIKITGQRYGIQIRNLGIWFTQSSTGCGITTDMSQTYTLTHAVIENIKILNCDKDSYAIQLSNFLHVNVRAIMSWGGPLLNIYANKPSFNQGNSIFDNLYGYVKYDLSPVDFTNGPYPIFIHKNDSASGTWTNLLNMRRVQINNPTGCSDSDYYTFTCWDLRYSTLQNFDFEGSNLQNHTIRMGSCYHVTFIDLYAWEADPNDAYVSVAANNQYVTFINPIVAGDIIDCNETDCWINPTIDGDIVSGTTAQFIGLEGNSGYATLSSGFSSITIQARYIGSNSKILLTIIDSDTLESGEFLKVESIDTANNRFIVKCGDEGTASTFISFFWQVTTYHEYP